jgi:hypothetical protein
MDIFVRFFFNENPRFCTGNLQSQFLRCSESVVGNGGLRTVLTSSKLALPLYVVSTWGLSSFKAVDMQIFLPSLRTPTSLFQLYNNSCKLLTM